MVNCCGPIRRFSQDSIQYEIPNRFRRGKLIAYNNLLVEGSSE